MTKMVSPDAISIILANPSSESSSGLQQLVVQVLDLKPTGNRYIQGQMFFTSVARFLVEREAILLKMLFAGKFTASDGKIKLKAILQSSLLSEVISRNIQKLGLICALDYTLNDIPTKNEKYLILTKCEAVSPALEDEYKVIVKIEEIGILLKDKKEANVKTKVKSDGFRILLKPKQEIVTKSAH